MKKMFAALLVLISLFALTSCATTKASEVPPVVREVPVADVNGNTMDADTIYKMLSQFADAWIGSDEELKIVKDDANKAVQINGFVLASNVGALAREGEIVTNLKLEAKEGSAVISLLFVDSYTYMQLGPITKKVSQGITELGLKELDYQANYIADHFEAGVPSYIILAQAGQL